MSKYYNEGIESTNYYTTIFKYILYTLLTVSFLLPKVAIDVLVSFLSIYIHKSLSKVLSVDGGPSLYKISFLLLKFKTNFSCFFSKKCTPWWFTTLFKLQFEIKMSKIK